MRIYKCDRCGAIFEKVPTSIDITMLTSRERQIEINSQFPVETSGDYTGTVDLCFECLHDIAAFLADPHVKTYDSTMFKTVGRTITPNEEAEE